MTSENLGMFHSWLSLPRDDAWAWKALQYLLAANVFWFLMFFGLGSVHPLSANLVPKTGD